MCTAGALKVIHAESLKIRTQGGMFEGVKITNIVTQCSEEEDTWNKERITSLIEY